MTRLWESVNRASTEMCFLLFLQLVKNSTKLDEERERARERESGGEKKEQIINKCQGVTQTADFVIENVVSVDKQTIELYSDYDH